jgi:hypothetical protein
MLNWELFSSNGQPMLQSTILFIFLSNDSKTLHARVFEDAVHGLRAISCEPLKIEQNESWLEICSPLLHWI